MIKILSAGFVILRPGYIWPQVRVHASKIVHSLISLMSEIITEWQRLYAVKMQGGLDEEWPHSFL